MKNQYKSGAIETCDNCGNKSEHKILWQDDYRYLWCFNCWPYSLPLSYCEDIDFETKLKKVYSLLSDHDRRATSMENVAAIMRIIS